MLRAGVAIVRCLLYTSATERLEAALLVGLGSYTVWKYVVAGLLVLHLLSTYVYFGKHPFWKYVDATARTLDVYKRQHHG